MFGDAVENQAESGERVELRRNHPDGPALR
jgi:hypothetical protein